MKIKHILVAVAWPYVNGDIHVGHLPGYLLPADIFARFQRLKGHDVLMVSGSDCFGTPITVEADKTKSTPEDIVQKYHQLDLALFDQYNLRYNLYTKTTTDNHQEYVQQLFMQLLQNGYIVKDKMKQYYSPKDKRFLPDRYVEGTCPHCKVEEQRSDQCESCGRWLEDGELINPISKLTGAKVELKHTEHYFLDFAKLQEQLRKYLDSRKNIWKKWVWAEADGWLREGLKKRAITRDLDWGIPLPVEEIKKLPKEKQLTDFSGKHIYVWFEAVAGYLTASIEWSKRVSGEITGSEDEILFFAQEGQSTSWRDYWKNESAEHYYFMGQDNLVFHTLMWPAQLMGAEQGYTLPYQVVVNKFMNYEGKKFSKSRNWTIDSKKIAETYGVDAVRYCMSANLPEQKEGNFTWDGFVSAVNNELVGNVGNFIHRCLTFLVSRYDRIVPKGALTREVRFEIRDAFEDSERSFSKVKISEALARIMKLGTFANKYFDSNKVWNTIKEDKKKADETMYNCMQLIQALRVLLSPFLPEASNRLTNMLRMQDIEWKIGKDEWRFVPIKAGKKIGDVAVLFEKLDPEVVTKNISKLS